MPDADVTQTSELSCPRCGTRFVPGKIRMAVHDERSAVSAAGVLCSACDGLGDIIDQRVAASEVVR